jgi:hypothetical protein
MTLHEKVMGGKKVAMEKVATDAESCPQYNEVTSPCAP